MQESRTLEGMRWGWLGIALGWSQVAYVCLRPEAQALRRRFEEAARGQNTLARQGPLWRGLQQVEAIAPELPNWYVLRFAGRDSIALLDSLRHLSELQLVEGAQYRRLWAKPVWDEPEGLLGWHHRALGTEAAWTRTQGSASLVIALIDSGTDWTLPAFHRQLWVNLPEDLNRNGTLDSLDLNSQDDDGNGFVDDVIGYDFTDQPMGGSRGDFLGVDPWPTDQNGHGTAMASLMVGRPDRSPVAGLAPGCRLLVLRCFNAEGYGEDDDIARALLYAVRQGARVLNCSFGEGKPSQLLWAAIRYATDQGAVIVAASGNGTGRAPHFPSGFPEVIAAGGLAYNETSGSYYLWPLSGYYRVDWLAPADRVPVLLPGGTVSLLSGTSLSAALTSAAAALLLSQYPSLTAADVRATFAARALPVGSRPTPYTGSGYLYLPPALDLPQTSQAGWIFPPEGAVCTSPIPLVFATYHSLLDHWEIEWRPELDSPPTLLASGDSPHLSDTLPNWSLPADKVFLRLILHLRNGGQETFTRTLYRLPTSDFQPFVEALAGWKEGLRGVVVSWRSGAFLPGCVSTPLGLYCADPIDSVGSVWLPAPLPDSLTLLLYGYPDTFRLRAGFPSVAPAALPYAPFAPAPQEALEGFYYPDTAPDWNANGQPDFLVSGASPETGPVGRLYFCALQSNRLQPYDSIPYPGGLLPRDLADWNGDGTPELLCVWLDSFYVWGGTPPKTLLWKGQGRAARLAGGQRLVLRTAAGHYAFVSSQGDTSLLLKDTLRWEGSTSIPRLLDLNTPSGRLWVFGNYAGVIFLYDEQGRLIRALHTGLLDVGSHLWGADIDTDGEEELLYAGRSPAEEGWEVGILRPSTGQWIDRQRFWQNVPTGGRFFVGAGKAALWLPPQLYVGPLTSTGWRVQAFDAETWGAFGLWAWGGDSLLLLGRDSVVRFYRLQALVYAGPVWARPGGLSPTSVLLRWHLLEPGLTYQLYRFSFSGVPVLAYSGPDTSYLDTGLTPDTDYLYAVRVLGGAFSEPFFVRPGPRPCLDSAARLPSGLIELRGRGLWLEGDPSAFRCLPSGEVPLVALASGNTWVLALSRPDSAREVRIDTLLRDAWGRFLSPACTLLPVQPPSTQPCIAPLEWRITGEHTMELRFSGTLPSRAYDPTAYRVFPTGQVTAIQPLSQGLAIQVSVPLTVQPITLAWDWGPPSCIRQVAFSPKEVGGGLWGFYPNPVKAPYRSVYFWGLPSGTRVRVLTPDGQLCAQWEVPDSESPVPWTLQTPHGTKLAPGVYLLFVENESWQAVEKLVIE